LIGVVVVAVALAGSAADAQTKGPRRGGTLRVALYNEVTTLDPGTTTNVPSIRVRNQIYETLLAWDKETGLQPMLADRYDVSPDGRTYVFALRKGVKFHDGSDFSAQDVKYTFERMAKVSPRKSDVNMIEAIEVVDPHTVRFRLKFASPLFLQALAMWFSQITPMQNTEMQVQKFGGIQDAVGTGPFKLAEWRRGQYMRLVRFADYKPRPEPASGLAGQKVAYVDEIVMTPIKDNKVRMLSLEQGESDYAERVPPEEADRLSANPQLEIKSVPSTNWSAFYFNCTLAPTSSQAFRQAVAYAINYDELNKAGYWGRGTVTNALIPEAQAVWRAPEHKIGYHQDLDKARRLLKEAGYTGADVSLVASTEPPFDLVIQNLQAQLKKVGINLKPTFLESAAHEAQLYVRVSQKKPPTWNIGANFGSAFRPDPHMHYYTRGHSDVHTGFCSNKAYDEVVEKAQRLLDPVERRKLYGQAHMIQLEWVPFIVFVDEPYIEGYRKNVKGVQILDPHWDMFWGVWLE
jgi:peptide/nickel transport system substrate-binding protein